MIARVFCLIVLLTLSAVPAAAQEQPPAWVPSTFCWPTDGSTPTGCGSGTTLNIGETARINVHRVICQRGGTCALERTGQVLEVTPLEVERGAAGETYTGTNEEAVLVKLRVAFVEAPPNPSTGDIRDFSLASHMRSMSAWTTESGINGRVIHSIYRRPALTPVGEAAPLHMGAVREGWIGGYVPSNSGGIALVLRGGEGDYYFVPFR